MKYTFLTYRMASCVGHKSHILHVPEPRFRVPEPRLREAKTPYVSRYTSHVAEISSKCSRSRLHVADNVLTSKLL